MDSNMPITKAVYGEDHPKYRSQGQRPERKRQGTFVKDMLPQTVLDQLHALRKELAHAEDQKHSNRQGRRRRRASGIGTRGSSPPTS